MKKPPNKEEANMEFIIIWVIFGAISAYIASNKGRSGAAWFFLGMLFGPLAILAAVIVDRI